MVYYLHYEISSSSAANLSAIHSDCLNSICPPMLVGKTDASIPYLASTETISLSGASCMIVRVRVLLSLKA